MCRYMMIKWDTKQKLILPHPALAQRTWIVPAKGVITGRFQTFIGFSYEIPHTICIGFSAKHILKYSFLACWPLKHIFQRQGKRWCGYFAPLNAPNFSVAMTAHTDGVFEFPVCSSSQTDTGTTSIQAPFPTKIVGACLTAQHKIWDHTAWETCSVFKFNGFLHTTGTRHIPSKL